MSKLVKNWPDIEFAAFKSYLLKIEEAFLKNLSSLYQSAGLECLSLTHTAFAVHESIYTPALQLTQPPVCIFTGHTGIILVRRIQFEFHPPGSVGTAYYSKTFDCASCFVPVLIGLSFLHSLPAYLEKIPSPSGSALLRTQVTEALRFLITFIHLHRKYGL
jgi:hypothetical protein